MSTHVLVEAWVTILLLCTSLFLRGSVLFCSLYVYQYKALVNTHTLSHTHPQGNEIKKNSLHVIYVSLSVKIYDTKCSLKDL